MRKYFSKEKGCEDCDENRILGCVYCSNCGKKL